MPDFNEMANVRDNLKSWLAAFNTKDIDQLLALYDPDSIYANAEAPLMHGIDQIKSWYEQAFSMVNGPLLFKEEALFQEEGMALMVGKYYFQPPTTNVTQDIGLTGRVALVYRRSEAGVWKLLFDMDNTPPDVQPADFV